MRYLTSKGKLKKEETKEFYMYIYIYFFFFIGGAYREKLYVLNVKLCIEGFFFFFFFFWGGGVFREKNYISLMLKLCIEEFFFFFSLKSMGQSVPYWYEGSFIINRKMPAKSAFFMLSTKFLHVFIP